jgi:hypothetical protein
MTVEERMHDLLEAAGDNVEPLTLEPAQRVLRRIGQRRRRVASVSVLAVVIAVAVTGTIVTLRHSANSASTSAATLSIQSRSLLARPLHLPSLAAGESCPATPGERIDTSLFSGVALGNGPVRVLLADRGSLLHGQVDLGSQQQLGDAHGSRWFAVQTLWFSTPGYNGPFVVRGQRLAGTGSMEVQPGSTGLAPGSGPLIVPSGPTINTSDGYRTVPGSSWVTAPGCYAWQVDGKGFSDVIVVDISRAARG